jgi:hypothetical protein
MQLKKAKNTKRNKTRKSDNTQRSVEQFAGDAYSLAKRSLAGLNEIRKFINIEEKYSDTAINVSGDQNGTVTCVSQLAQGTNVSNRVGDSVRVQRLSLIGRIAVNSAVTTYSIARVIVFRDMEGQGTAPAMSDVLESVGTSAAPRQPYDWLNRKRFSILADWLIPLTAISGGSMVRELSLDIDLAKHVLYRGTTAAAASDGEGSIYVGVVSDEATNTPGLGAVARITYTDD